MFVVSLYIFSNWPPCFEGVIREFQNIISYSFSLSYKYKKLVVPRVWDMRWVSKWVKTFLVLPHPIWSGDVMRFLKNHFLSLGYIMKGISAKFQHSRSNSLGWLMRQWVNWWMNELGLFKLGRRLVDKRCLALSKLSLEPQITRHK